MNYQILKNIIDVQLERFREISEAEWSAKESLHKWSKKEILGHLCDSALTNIRRFIITQYKQDENIVYDQDFWVKAQNYQNISTEEIIQLWKTLNLQIVNVVENLPDEFLNHTCDMTKTTPQRFTLQYIITDHIDHMNHHLKSI